MSNPIIKILATETLTGENFVKWKSNMNIVLVCENFKFVLTEECPPRPHAKSSVNVAEAYDRWQNANNKARCYLLAGMSDVLRCKHETVETTKGIVDSLEEMFGRPSEQSRHEAVKALMNTRMKNGTSVREHTLKMIEHINEAEIHGANIDEATQVGMILETLSPNFLQFKSNYFMNKFKYNMTQLLNELQTFESISNEKGGEANVAEATTSSSGKSKRRKNQNTGSGKLKNKKGNFKAKKNNNNNNKAKSSDKKAKGKCFHCGIDGHWKRNCKKYLEELKIKKKGKSDLLVLEACLVENDTSSWIVDSGATNHVCCSMQMFDSATELADGDYTMRMGNGAMVSAKVVGEV